ncbi:MAG TPA: flagellar export chaperone FliS [Candidatus Binatia bacterium]
MTTVRQLQAYKETQITTTDPGTVLLLLYQGAIDALNRAAGFMAAGNMADKGKQILKANDIINQFIASLDFEVGGELAHNLEGLYRFMLEQILFANAHNEAKPLTTVVSLLTTLKSGWDEAVALQRKRAVQGAA